jgi:hypothetical protein
MERFDEMTNPKKSKIKKKKKSSKLDIFE